MATKRKGSSFRQMSTERNLESIFLFVTGRCNAKCAMCFYAGDMDDKLGELTFDEIKKISETAGNINKLWISGGEPTLREDLPEIIEMFYRNNHIKDINWPTNGLQADRVVEWVKRIRKSCPDCNVSISVSMDGFTDTHDKQRGVPGNFYKALDQIKKINENFSDDGYVLQTLATVMTKYNVDQISDLMYWIYGRFNSSNHIIEAARGETREEGVKVLNEQSLRAIQDEVAPMYSLYAKRMAKGVSPLKRPITRFVYQGFLRTIFNVRADNLEGPKPWGMDCTAGETTLDFTCGYYPDMPEPKGRTARQVISASASHWQKFWQSGGAVDFSLCTDARAAELERRVVLSQYLTAIQCTGSVPPQESGLTYNTWFGRPHLEMHWWHGVHFPLWGRSELLARSLPWYETAYPHAVEIARRQGYDGARWMKMTDPWAGEAPSNVGSFLIWQQPHFIYFAELVYRADPSPETIEKYKDLVFATADFMYSFATYDAMEGRFVLEGLIPAQETLRAAVTVNPPLELSYWHYAMETAQRWRERAGLRKNLEWEELIDKLSPLAYNDDGLYLAAETAPDTYIDVRFTSDHMAVLGALGMLPKSKLVREDYMENTLEWVWENWNWGKTWGWDFPMTAMNAARLGRTDLAVGALLMDKRTNTYLVSGHNYQDPRLRIYMPGNGGLLTAVAMMCAGWDGAPEGIDCPGFPKDGKWDVRWEGLEKMP